MGRIFFAKKEEEREWTSPDSRLKLTYPASWTETDQTSLEYFRQANISLAKKDLLFLAYRFDLKGQGFAFFNYIKEKEGGKLGRNSERNEAKYKRTEW